MADSTGQTEVTSSVSHQAPPLPAAASNPFAVVQSPPEVTPSKVEQLYKCWWRDGQLASDVPTLKTIRNSVLLSLQNLREYHKRSLNPTPYKVSVSDELYRFIHDLWLENQPIGELS